MSIRVLLADDHRMLRDALKVLLTQNGAVSVVAEAGDGNQALEAAAQHLPDIVIIDVRMPGLNGIEATRKLRGLHPAPKVIALSAITDHEQVMEMLNAGASAFVAKAAAGTELWRAIEAVRSGQTYLSPEISVVLAEAARNLVHRDSAVLGQRETSVLKLLAEGLRSSEIAARLHIAPSTVEVHRRNIMRKLNLHSAIELTKFAIRERITSI